MTTTTIEAAGEMGLSMPAEACQVALRVRGGLHDGAGATLGIGSYVIGRAPHCDFVLRDDGIADEQLLLTVSAAGVHVRALADGALRGGTKLATDASSTIVAPTVVRLGTVQLGMCRGDIDSTVFDAWETDAAGAAPAPPADTLMHRAEVFAKRRPYVSAGLALLLLAGGIGIAVSAVRDGGLLGMRSVAESRVETTRAKVAALSLHEVKVTRTPTGEPLLTGYVADLGALRRLRQAVADGARLSVYPADELVRYSQEWMAGHGYRIDVAYAGDGKVVLSGDETGKRGFQEAANRLVLEVPGLAGVDSAVTPVAAAPLPPPAAPKAEEPYVLSGVTGVNAGDKVRYLTSGNTVIFTGGALRNGMTVRQIEAERVVVDDPASSTQEVKLR